MKLSRTSGRALFPAALLTAVLAGASLLAGGAGEGKGPARTGPFVFRDVGDEAGLFPHAAGIRGHGAAWGDADGDGWIDLYVATFHTGDGKPNVFFRNAGGKFRLDEQGALRISTRATGVLFADLDNDGDLDLYVASMPAGEGSRLAARDTSSNRRPPLLRKRRELFVGEPL